MKITLPLTIYGKYQTDFSYAEIINILDKKTSEKYLLGMKIDKYEYEENNKTIKIQRYSIGLDAFLESFPLIKMKIENENSMVANVKITPSYFRILFFAVFVIVFIPAAFFAEKWTINDILRTPTLPERFLFSLAGIIPGIWCYFQFIRPIKKTEKWLIEKLKLQKL
ncbi:hypothetical protein [Kaistella jeonii]|uniref:Uncharacterized protein n=1 Tax=Kaistella jeonii TaxID=266749 RepID=A0A0C1CNM1_9FLAO|nr:hypothetical protein [Kaistella jeonii]KIA82620.1 hypothetical protein OA86_14980 [Kaistella jeonii]SFC46085.1 hypothetical protein SAMN05421876_1331 [Kaistella jeonii]VEI96510.1 Uncharacterised protein [Kaistella jeonii]